MKIRKGFVSNSSSSSFVIMSKEKLTINKLMNMFGVPKKSPMYDICEEIAIVMMRAEEYTNESYRQHIEDDYDGIENYYYIEELRKAEKDGFKYFYGGEAYSDGESAEAMLCDMNIDYENEDLIIKKDGGY